MSPRPPVFKAAELIRLPEKNGFRRIGQTGSHMKLRNEAGITVIIPAHKGKDLAPGLTAAILKKAGIEPDSF